MRLIASDAKVGTGNNIVTSTNIALVPAFAMDAVTKSMHIKDMSMNLIKKKGGLWCPCEQSKQCV